MILQHGWKIKKAFVGMHKLYILILASLLVSCNANSPKYKIGVSQCSEDIWRNWQNAELRMEANFHEGVELRFAAAFDDSRRQIQQIDSLVNGGIDLLIVAPNQLQSVSPAIDRAFDKGIPVIVFERKTGSRKYTAFVSADNYEMGRQMGMYIARQMNEKGKVMEILGLKGSSPADERHKGFRDALQTFPQIQVVTSLQGDWTEETAYKVVKQWLEGDAGKALANGGIDFVFGHNDRTALGARKAMVEKGMKLPKFCGIDGLPGENGGIRQVRDSILIASYIYPTRGDQLLQLALDILQGKPYEKEIMLTSALVTNDNANVLLLESDEVMRQSKNLEKLQEKASDYMKRISNQRLIIFLSLGVALLLLLLAAAIWLYNRQRSKLIHERMKMEREQLDFYTQVSHELRTPLTLIEGPLAKLSSTQDMKNASQSTTELLDIVTRNTHHLTRLINKMLEVQIGGAKMDWTANKDDEIMMASPADTSSHDQSMDKPAPVMDNDDKPTVLIVDDNADIRTFLRSIMKDKYQLLESEDGQKGLEMAKTNVPDIIVSDVMMPVMNGLEFCQRVKDDTITSHIPVILLTARALNKHQIEGYQSGADAYITKPFSSELLLVRIDNLLRNRHLLKDIWANVAPSVTPAASIESKAAPDLDDKKEAAEQKPTPSELRDNEFITRFKKVIEEKLADSDLSVEDIAADMHLSRVQLYRKVKALTGATPVELLRKARLSRARVLLETTSKNISEVAYEVGFSAPSYFTKCYKDEFGILPGEGR